MKLYQTIDGTLIGFYGEKGGEVRALLYRDNYEKQMVTKTREEEYTIPGYYEKVEVPVPGYYKDERVYIQGHYERKMIWKPAYYVTRYREVPGHYEIQPYWFEEYSVTRYRTVPGYWEPYERDIPPRGVYEGTGPPYTWYRWIDEHVEEYEEVIPAGFKDTRVWVDTYTEEYEELIPAGESMGRVWIEGHYETEKTWVPATTKTEQVWIEAETKMITVEFQELEDVWVGREPIYEYVDPMEVQTFEVLELIEAPADRPDIEDKITIRNTLTNEVLTTTATYIGLGQQIDENEYVVP